MYKLECCVTGVNDAEESQPILDRAVYIGKRVGGDLDGTFEAALLELMEQLKELPESEPHINKTVEYAKRYHEQNKWRIDFEGPYVVVLAITQVTNHFSRN